jgi:UDP-3-O-[3-hydroxymyristoyl] glucosamine N-acyltransferase
MAEYKVRELAALVGGVVEGDGDRVITGVNGLTEAGPGDVTFVANPRYAGAVKDTRAGAVIAGDDIAAPGKTFIRVAQPYVAFAQILTRFAPAPAVPREISDLAFIHATATLGKDVGVGPFAIIEEGAVIGDRASIGAGVYVGPGAAVGPDSIIYPHVSLRERVRVGARCIIHLGAVIGSDGFGFATANDVHHKIPQVGTVVVEDDVEIGANCAIDRGTMGETRIGRGSKLDNLIQIAHNVHIGEGTLIAAQTGIAGSTRVGKYCVFAGQVGVVPHITIGDRAILAAQAGIAKSVPPGETYFGYPARPIREVKRNEARISLLAKLFERVKELERKVEQLEGGAAGPADGK